MPPLTKGSFKVVVLEPLLKNSTLSPEALASYRPISTFSAANQLCNILKYNCSFEDFLLGSRVHYSKETALVKVTHDHLNASDNNIFSVLVLLHLSKILLLNPIGIKGTTLKWFQSYLLDQSQFVHANHQSCMHIKMSSGVPRVSVLVPFFYTYYVFTFGKIINKHNPIVSSQIKSVSYHQLG